ALVRANRTDFRGGLEFLFGPCVIFLGHCQYCDREMCLDAFWVRGNRVIQKSLSFWQILLAHGQGCVGYFEIRAVVMREFLHLLFRNLDLLRSGCRFSEQDQSWSVVRCL